MKTLIIPEKQPGGGGLKKPYCNVFERVKSLLQILKTY